jgi:hypothetical protein
MHTNEFVSSSYVRGRWPFGRLSYVELQRKVDAGLLPKPFKMSDKVSRDGRSRQRNYWRQTEIDAAIAALVARANRAA